MNDRPLCSEANALPLALRLGIADAMFSNASEGVCIIDAEQRIIEVNPTLCALSGYSRDELLGRSPEIFRSGLQGVEFYEDLQAALDVTGQWTGELWNQHRTGSLYACRMNIFAISDDSGEVTHYLSIQADITPAKIYQERLEKSANYDALTQLPNRGLLMDRLHQAMAQSQRTGLMLAICYLDLDGFKAINDTHGHEAGDLALIEAARRMAAAVRVGDTVARVGGDEFVILLWGVKDSLECEQTLSRVVSAIAAITTLGALEVNLKVSIGLTLFPNDGSDPAVLMAQADSAMYRSKMAGGGGWRYFKA
ncbi:MAG: sensor domain-containing diguanylate cyclase [Rhodocyclaceae bacterium]|nr:sensor domain-containing diguanylate cyclase [Rhodocyclaceae bacterium]